MKTAESLLPTSGKWNERYTAHHLTPSPKIPKLGITGTLTGPTAKPGKKLGIVIPAAWSDHVLVWSGPVTRMMAVKDAEGAAARR